MSAEEIAENYAKFGCHHIACGRRLRGHHTAAAPWLESKMRRDAPHYEGLSNMVEGARAYASLKGFDDPHTGVDYHGIRQTADRIHHLAREYASLPHHDPQAVPHFEAMRQETNQQFDHLTKRMGVKVQTVDHDPYKHAGEMIADLRNNNRLKVLGTHMTGGHPYFSDEENDKFRAVHDAFGHAAIGRSFDGHGEEAAFHAHARMFSPMARAALASETRGQNGFVIKHGEFGPQKIAVMRKELWTPDGMSHTGAADHDVLYHITDNPHFALDPDKVPEDNTLAIYSRERKGLFTTRPNDSWAVESWLHGHGYARPYVAEIHAPKDAHEPGRWNGEHFIPAENYGRVKVNRVIPLDAHARETYGSHGWIEQHHGTEYDTGKPIKAQPYEEPFKGWRYPGPDARDMTPEQHQHHKERALEFLRHGEDGRYGFDDEGVEEMRQRWASRRAAFDVDKHRRATSANLCSECGRRFDDHPKIDTLYHATSPLHRSSISQTGLRTEFDKGDGYTPRGVYLAEHPEPLPANSPVPRHYQDTWAVDTRGLKLHPDPYYEPADGQVGNAFYVTHDIEPSRLRLHIEGDVDHPWNAWRKRQAADVSDYRRERELQERRAEEYSRGYGAERDEFYGRDGHDAVEKPLLYSDWLRHTKQPRLTDMDPEFQSEWHGYEVGHRHGLAGHIDNEELERESNGASHLEHFLNGYEEGLGHGLDARENQKQARIAVMVGDPKVFVRVAHVSGNTIDALHCFAGDTRYLTPEGVKTLAETVGTVQKVLTGGAAPHDGRWVDAMIHEFGEQPLLRVTLKRNKQLKVVRATAHHDWLLTAGPDRDQLRRVKTTDLRPGQRLPHLRAPRALVDPNHDGIRMGVVFGDGYIARSRATAQGQVTLWGPKMDLAKYFDEVCPTRGYERETSNGVPGISYSSGLPGYHKELPALSEPQDYLMGWLMGYFAADGEVSKIGQCSLSSSSLETLLHVRDICTLLGIGTYAPTTKMRKGYGTEPTAIHTMGFSALDLGESFFLREDQRAAARVPHHERFGWTVVSVEDRGEVETVYCPRVPGTESFVLEDNIHTGQCPFCGSGSVTARSDGSIECGFCTAAYTVQVQPQYAAFPQSVNGSPYPWPGRDDMGGGVMSDAQVDPNAPVAPDGSPMGQGAPVGAGAPVMGGDGEMDDEDGDEGDDAPPFAKDGDSDDDEGGEAQVGGKKSPPFEKGKKKDKGKKESAYRNVHGQVLSEDDFVRHLAIVTASDPRAMAFKVKASRQ